MSDKAEAARKAFAQRLKALRLDAGLNGKQLAALTGLHNSKISRIEAARQNPSEDDIKTWATACSAKWAIPELIAAHREVEQMWIELKRENRIGQKHVQTRSTPLYAQTRLLRAYESTAVPGILMTLAYTKEVLRLNAITLGVPLHDVDEAAEARLARQHLVTSGSGRNRYHFILEAGVLDNAFGSVTLMQEQLDFLIQVTRLPNVALGIIPPNRVRTVLARECFYLFDEQLVRSEFWTGGYRTKRPDEIATFAKIFGMLRDHAVYGVQARELIEAAKARLQTAENS